MKILVVNGGSSSFKFSLFESERVLPFHARPIWSKVVEFKDPSEDRKKPIQETLREIANHIEIVGHRIVHGGNLFQKPTLINAEVKNAIQKLSRLAPLHNPVNLEGIEIAEELFPMAQQVGIFDTAFHATMPEVAWTYPGPWEWRDDGIRRYGFHGINHQYCSEAIQNLMKTTPKKLITCHLGNGSSCTAILDGKVIDTTMGFTPMEGLMMGTRSGTVDPGIIIYLEREKMFTIQEVDHCLNKESGLLGIGGSFDMREIEARAKKNDSRANLAFNLYVYRLKQAIGSLTASLDGLDTLCFTGGIGENSAEVRQRTIEGLKYFGIKIDQEKNRKEKEEGEISAPDSKVRVFIIHAREDWMIAKECLHTNLSSECGRALPL